MKKDKPMDDFLAKRAEIYRKMGVDENDPEWVRFEAFVRFIAQAKPPPGGFRKKLKADREARKRAKDQ